MNILSRRLLKHTTYRIIGVLSVLILICSGQVQALTQNDIFCIQQGGTCFYDPNAACSTSTAAVSVQAGGDRAKTAFEFFVSKGLTPAQAGGILGNLEYESGVNPLKIQGGTESKDPNDAGSGGYGIAQWTQGSKLLLILTSAHVTGDPYDLLTQLNALWAQLDGTAGSFNEKQAGDDIKSAPDIDEATKAFQGTKQVGGKYFGFERPSDESGTINRRIALGKADATKYGNAAPTAMGPTMVSTAASNTSCCPPTVSPTDAAPDASIPDGSPSDWTKMYTGADKTKTDIMSRGKIDPSILVIHFTVGEQEGEDLLDFFATGGGNPDGIQFNIGKTGTVYQYYPLNNMQKTNHVGNANSKSIGIEITGHDTKELLANDQQFQSVVATAKFLCDKYNIPCSNPKGDMTGDGLSAAQGMLGHDETPTNDHTDPDSDVSANGMISYNHNTHAVWSAADRKDSSQHPYMMKLRAAMGFDPTPGHSGGAPATTTPVSDDASACSTTTADTASGSGTDKDPVGDGPNRALAFEAVKYDTATNNNKYTYQMGGLHGPLSQLQAFADRGGQTDCSGFVRYVIWKVYGVDVGSFVTQDLPTNSNFEEVNPSDVEAGDIGWREEHVDFITQNKGGGVLHQFGAHSEKTNLYGADTKAENYTKFYRYTGPKATIKV